VPETYVHRIGRTARAGAEGIAISLCDAEEAAYLRDIEKLIRMSIPMTDKRSHPGRDEPQTGKRDGKPARSHAPGKHVPVNHGKSGRGKNGRGNGDHGKNGRGNGDHGKNGSRSGGQTKERHWHRGGKPRNQTHQGQPQQGHPSRSQQVRGHSNHDQPRDIASVAFLNAGASQERN